MPNISVIVPVYNAENSLRRCVDSILSQTYDNFELLLIDDGSKDRSSDICDEYAKKDSRIKVFHKINEGVSSARNVGISASSGLYLIFVDSDDWIDSDFISTIMKYKGIDLISVSSIFHGDKGITIHRNDNSSFKGEFAFYDLLKRGINIDCMRAPWGKAFKHDIIKKYDLKFDETLRSCEDTLFILYYCLKCNTISILSEPLYNYEFSSINVSNSLSRNELLYIENYDNILSKYWNFNDVFKTIVNIKEDIICYKFMDTIFITILNAVLKTHKFSILRTFAQNKYVKRCVNSYGLNNNYGRKGKVWIKLLRYFK